MYFFSKILIISFFEENITGCYSNGREGKKKTWVSANLNLTRLAAPTSCGIASHVAQQHLDRRYNCTYCCLDVTHRIMDLKGINYP